MYGGPIITSTDWVPPSSSTGTSYAIPSFEAAGYGGSTNPDEAVTGDVNVQATVTLTWVPDQTLPSDPAPPSLWLIESSSSTYTDSYSDNGTDYQGTGSADDGLQDAPVATTSHGTQTGAVSSSANATATTKPPPHWINKPVSGGSITLTHTFKAHTEASMPNDGGSGVMNAFCSFDGYTVKIHAQPYNFRATNFSNTTPPASVINTAGELQFYYTWSSTDGVMGDLTGETIHENVDAPSSPSYTLNGVASYDPPPPFNWVDSFHFDRVHVDASSTDGITDSHSWGNGQSPITDAFVQKYVANSFNLTQTYKFNDPATMASGVEQAVPGASGPITITDAVVADPNSPSGYSFILTKSGIPSLPQPLP